MFDLEKALRVSGHEHVRIESRASAPVRPSLYDPEYAADVEDFQKNFWAYWIALPILIARWDCLGYVLTAIMAIVGCAYDAPTQMGNKGLVTAGIMLVILCHSSLWAGWIMFSSAIARLRRLEGPDEMDRFRDVEEHARGVFQTVAFFTVILFVLSVPLLRIIGLGKI